MLDEGEVVVDEVRQHPVAYLFPAVELLLVAIVLGVAALVLAVSVIWIPAALAVALFVHFVFQALRVRTDRLVITNVKVLRTHGLLAKTTDLVPLEWLAGVRVRRSILGRMLGYGHLQFESTAQKPAFRLRPIYYVERPDERYLALRRLTQGPDDKTL